MTVFLTTQTQTEWNWIMLKYDEIIGVWKDQSPLRVSGLRHQSDLKTDLLTVCSKSRKYGECFEFRVVFLCVFFSDESNQQDYCDCRESAPWKHTSLVMNPEN